MKFHENSFLALLTIAAGVVFTPAYGQAPAAAPEPAAVAKEPSSGTLLDLVVRDKKGRLIADLAPSGVTVSDDGSKQNISGFRLIQGGESVSADGAKTALDPLHQVRLVTLVFESMADADLRSPERNTSPGRHVIGS